MNDKRAFPRISTTLLITFAGFFLGACGGDDRTPTPAAPLTVDEYPLARAQATCDFAFRCCEPADRTVNLPEGASTTDAAACPGVTAADIESVLDGRLATGGTFDEMAAGECVATIRALPCGRRYEIKDIPVCQAMVRGSDANGTSCAGDAYCASNYCSEFESRDVCADPVSTIGAECTVGDACAGKGEYCDEATARCLATKPFGASCTEDRECEGRLDCTDGRCDYESRPGCGGA
jgi:hypothetical protein